MSSTLKRFLIIFGILLWLQNMCSLAYGQLIPKLTRVVIDAGHGGKDPGALGRNSQEKDIVLAVALKTGKYIQNAFEDIEVIYTRTTDEFVELHKRAQIANESGADLFISIHCNSNKSSRPFGTETFVMGLHKSQDNLDVAKTENAAIYYEEDYKTQYEGFDPHSDEDYIVLSMFQSANIDQSISLSSKVQQQFTKRVGRKDRGVKQAGFWVLYKTTMPGILIELGFLSNPEEEKFLMSEKGQDYMASAIFRAFRDYKNEFEEINGDMKPLVVEEPDPQPKVYYRVQFASYRRERSLDFRKFRGLKDVKVYEHDDQYKYTTGNTINMEEAISMKNKLIREGYKDAFVVAFVNEERVSLDKAKTLAENPDQQP